MGNVSRATDSARRTGNKGRRLLMGKLPCGAGASAGALGGWVV